jgi:hypothetical protein
VASVEVTGAVEASAAVTAVEASAAVTVAAASAHADLLRDAAGLLAGEQ